MNQENIFRVVSESLQEISSCTYVYKHHISGAVEGVMHKRAIELTDEEKKEAIKQTIEGTKKIFDAANSGEFRRNY